MCVLDFCIQFTHPQDGLGDVTLFYFYQRNIPVVKELNDFVIKKEKTIE